MRRGVQKHMDLKEQYMSMPYDLSGSRSKNRFRVELLWGIDKMLKLMENDKPFTMVFDYVCDIEVHMEDEFEFYQIKTHSKSQSAYTTTSLTKKESKNSQGSILGKLFVLNANEGRNNLIAIVSNSPYRMTGNNIYNGIHCFNDFPNAEKEKIVAAIKTELNVEEVDLSTAFYICTSMDLENPQNAITGQLVLSFKKLRGCEVERPATLYCLIYDQVSEKACYELPIRSYEEIIEKKGITRGEMEHLFDCHAQSAKTGIDQTSKYIDSLADLVARKKYKKALAKLVKSMPVDKVLQNKEKEVASYLVNLEKRRDLQGSVEEIIDALTTQFHDTFPIGYDNAEKTVFYIIIINKFTEGVYDEDDI